MDNKRKKDVEHITNMAYMYKHRHNAHPSDPDINQIYDWAQDMTVFDEEEVLNFKKAVVGLTRLTSVIMLSKSNSKKNYSPFMWFYLKNDTSTVKEFEDYFSDGFRYQEEDRGKTKNDSEEVRGDHRRFEHKTYEQHLKNRIYHDILR